MQMKDSIQLAHWLRGKASLAEVESIPRFGLVDNERFTEQARRAYRLIWAWSAPRFSGRIGAKQEQLWNRHGRDFVERRIERCRRLTTKFLGAA